jgi:hypothetical protein
VIVSPLLFRLRVAQEARAESWRELLAQFEERQRACTAGEHFPEPYVVLSIQDKAGGVGNLLPGVVTGQSLFLPN